MLGARHRRRLLAALNVAARGGDHAAAVMLVLLSRDVERYRSFEAVMELLRASITDDA